MDADWQADLELWLDPFLKGLGNKTRQRMCPAYIAGLIGPGDRKSIQPMAPEPVRSAMTASTISSALASGTARLWKPL